MFIKCVAYFYISIGAGLPFTSSAVVDMKRSESGLSAELALHAGAQELKLTLQRRLHNSTEIAGRLLVSAPFSISLQFHWYFLIMWLIFPKFSFGWFTVVLTVYI